MVELLCTLTGIITGIALVGALMQQAGDRSRFESAEPIDTAEEADMLKGLTSQLQMLTHRVAADVSAHTQKVVHINEKLLPVQNEPDRILSAIAELIQANESMHGQLAAAQLRLSKQSEQIEATAKQARTDALTGLANRRALEESLRNCIDSIGQPNVTGLLLIDIDHFKSFNDSYGHTTGDAVLASFARSISKWCDGKYYSARYGGEEFAVILTGQSCEELAKLAAEVRSFVSEQIICHEDLRLTITASAGLAMLQEGDTLKRIYERSDEGLYRSKKAGRNCGHWLDDGNWTLFPGTQANESGSTETANLAALKHIEELKQHIAKPRITTVESQEMPANADDSEVLDLASFLDRLEAQVKQLSRANMPATALMIEAIGLSTENEKVFERSWAQVLRIVYSNLRGIDVVCRLRQNSLCVFLPGCALNATLERAGGMQHALEELRSSSSLANLPERLAISAATAMHNEEAGEFLQRLEAGLEEAHDAAPLELVVSNANNSYFHAT